MCFRADRKKETPCLHGRVERMVTHRLAACPVCQNLRGANQSGGNFVIARCFSDEAIQKNTSSPDKRMAERRSAAKRMSLEVFAASQSADFFNPAPV
jgi:hypothetical protein